MLKDNEKSYNVCAGWKNSGVRIITNNCKNIIGRLLLNFIVQNLDGCVCLKTIDLTGNVRDHKYVVNYLITVIEDIEARNVIHVATDLTNNMVNISATVNTRFSTIAQIFCRAHSLTLLLQNIEKLLWATSIIHDLREIISYFKNYKHVLHM